MCGTRARLDEQGEHSILLFFCKRMRAALYVTNNTNIHYNPVKTIYFSFHLSPEQLLPKDVATYVGFAEAFILEDKKVLKMDVGFDVYL